MNEHVYRPTTAYWKIRRLILDGAKKGTRTFVIQGGQGAGKTVGICMLLIQWFHKGYFRTASIFSAEASKLRETTVLDCQNIIDDWNAPFNIKQRPEKIVKDNTHFIEFKGVDAKGIGKGRRRDIIYINEADKLSFQEYVDITARAQLVIIDFNPDRRFWAHDLIEEGNFISLTFQDNEFLKKKELQNILDGKARGYIDPDLPDYEKKENIKSEFWANWWRVYGKGEIGSVEGRVFSNWKQVPLQKYQELKLMEFYGVDWGKNHKMGIIRCKYDPYENNFYIDELNYLSENELYNALSAVEMQEVKESQGGIIVHIMRKINPPADAYIICDSAVPDNIAKLREHGWSYAIGIDKPRGSVMANITRMQSVNVFYTDRSKNLEFEYQSYSYKKDRLGVIDDEVIPENDDLIDPAMYALRFIFKEYVRA